MFFKKGNKVLGICDYCFIESKETNSKPIDVCYVLFDSDYIRYNVCKDCYYKNGTLLGQLKNINPKNSVFNMKRKIKRLELVKKGWEEI